MKLKEGSLVTILGRLDEDTWEDATTGEKKSVPVIILTDIEYCFSGGNKKADNNGNHETPPVSSPAAAPQILLHLKILQDLKHLAAEILSLMNKEDTEQLNQAH